MYEEQQAPSGSPAQIGSDKGAGKEVTCVGEVVDIVEERILKMSIKDLVEEELIRGQTKGKVNRVVHKKG